MTSSDLVIVIKKQPVGFACGMLSLVLAGFLYYRASAIDEKQTEYETKSAEAAKIVSNVTTSKNLPEQVQEIQSLTKDLESRLVNAGQLAINQQYFYKLELENEVKLLEVRQNNQQKKGATVYSGVSFSVTVQGPFKKIMNFLNHIENGRHLCRFTGAVFSKNRTSGGAGSAQDDMTLVLNLELLGQP